MRVPTIERDACCFLMKHLTVSLVGINRDLVEKASGSCSRNVLDTSWDGPVVGSIWARKVAPYNDGDGYVKDSKRRDSSVHHPKLACSSVMATEAATRKT